MRSSPWPTSRRRRGHILAVVLLSASPALAGPGQPGAVPGAVDAPSGSPATEIAVSWPDVARLVERHPRLSAARLRVDAARGGVDAAGAAQNPTLEGEVGQGLARTGSAARLEWGLALTVPLGWIAQRRARIDAAEAEVDAALADDRALRREVLLQLRILFWNLVYEQSRTASLETLATQTSALVRAVGKRVDSGEARPVELLRVEVENEKIAGELESARTSLSARRAALALWLGLPAGGTLVAIADLGALPDAPDRDTALGQARATHPALAMARAAIRGLEAEVEAERMARVPPLDITGFAASELDRLAYGLGLAVVLPVWNWNSGPIARAEAELAAAREQAAATGLEVEESVLDAQAACQASVATATRLGNSVVPRSESVASTMEKTYQLGEASLLEVIDARRTLLDSRRLYLGALAQAQIDCSRLGALVGEEPR